MAPLGLLIFVACGDSSGPSTPYAGGWSGSTSQGHQIRFLVEGNNVTIVTARWVVDGTLCTRNAETVYFLLGSDVPRSISNETFFLTQVGTDVDFVLNGAFSSANAAAGSLTVTSAACNGLSEITWTATKTSSASVNVSGTWDGQLQSNLLDQAPIVLLPVQSGSELAGNYQRPVGNGTIEGTIVDRLMHFTMTQTAAGCPGTFEVRGAVLRTAPSGSLPPADSLHFGFAGSDCAGTHRGSGFARRR